MPLPLHLHVGLCNLFDIAILLTLRNRESGHVCLRNATFPGGSFVFLELLVCNGQLIGASSAWSEIPGVAPFPHYLQANARILPKVGHDGLLLFLPFHCSSLRCVLLVQAPQHGRLLYARAI